jgi:arylsulfatase A
MTACMDKMVGNVVAELEKHGLHQKTLVLFTGDNGTNVRITSKMGDRRVRGGKGSSKDNVIHVPPIASWPGTIPEGSVSQDLVDTTDFLPTICEAAGIEVPARLAIDGRSFLPRLRGGVGRPREWVYCWDAREGGAQAALEFVLDQRFKLYRNGKFLDLTLDIEEQQPLDIASLAGDAAAHQRMTAALDRFRGARPAHIVAQAGKPGAGSDR